ncbi:DNA-directed RNA polymerases I, II, and III subunit RPABC2 [Pancytospora epiphaga]|nr:DNA-directed RNA polymerases I, II, and III subunit RPABC2 [Pancytospora epiphaga]
MDGGAINQFTLENTNEQAPQEQTARTTLNRMTIYEKAHIIGVRAAQLSDDAPPLVDIGNMTDCIQIATKELMEKKLPFIVRRKLPDGTVEDWGIDELLIPEVDF